MLSIYHRVARGAPPPPLPALPHPPLTPSIVRGGGSSTRYPRCEPKHPKPRPGLLGGGRVPAAPLRVPPPRCRSRLSRLGACPEDGGSAGPGAWRPPASLLLLLRCFPCRPSSLRCLSAMASGASAADCLREWEELQEGYQRIQDNHKLYKQKLEELTKLQDGISSSIARQKKRLKELSLSLKKCKAHASPEQQESIQETQSLIKERQNVFFEMEAYLPKKNGLYLSLVLGNVNVTLLSKQAKFAYKDEYEKFKLYLTIILLIVSFSCRFLLNSRVTDAVFNFLLVWYYCTLTIRESILINNGSKIKGWWVFHHYVSTFLSGVMLTWLCAVPPVLLPERVLVPAPSAGREAQHGSHCGGLPVLDVARPHVPAPLPLLRAVLAAVQRRHALQDAPAPGVQGVAGPHVRPPLLHPLPGELLHHPPRRPPEVSEPEQRHQAGLKRGAAGDQDCLFLPAGSVLRSQLLASMPSGRGCLSPFRGTELGGCS
uniref:Transmembrane protein 120A n=1 Tax=Anas platyrhynchos TaxID=8839 RepID=A0A8B9SJM4_ANAPL